MGQESLGNCTIISPDDKVKLKINLIELVNSGTLELINKTRNDHFETPIMKAFTDNGVRKKLRDYIEKDARKKEADLAYIEFQGEFGGFKSQVSYSYLLYKYKK